MAHILKGSDCWGQVASFDARAPQQSSRLSLKGRGWGIDISLGHPPLLCLLFEGTNKYQAGRALVNRPLWSPKVLWSLGEDGVVGRMGRTPF